jgi:hypothetical protein
MTLKREIENLYQGCGKRHLLPFIGRAFNQPSVTDIRVAVIGINAYAREDSIDNTWFRSWWKEVGQEDTSGPDTKFYKVAYADVDTVANAMNKASAFRGRRYRSNADAKENIYATNAIKYFTTERLKDSSKISAAQLKEGGAFGTKSSIYWQNTMLSHI